MLTRIYIDNFRCFVDFEYRPERKQLILGRNGSGKSSLLRALLMLRQFVNRGDQAEERFPFVEKTRGIDRPTQTFEVEVTQSCSTYSYRLVIGPEGEPPRPRVVSESLYQDGKPILQFTKGEVQVFNANFEVENSYPFDSNRSALAMAVQRGQDSPLAPFKKWFGGLYCFSLNPFAMGTRAEEEQSYPKVDLSNVACWYRHLYQTYPREYERLRLDLTQALDRFSYMNLEPVGENVRLLVAEFSEGNHSVKFGFAQLSDGQRCLICLYIILHFIIAKGGTVILDEPDNFISLQEIQPWLVAVEDAVEEKDGQVLIISHHPEFINQWAPGRGVRFVRDGIGAVKVQQFRGDPESPLSPAELVARGWESG